MVDMRRQPVESLAAAVEPGGSSLHSRLGGRAGAQERAEPEPAGDASTVRTSRSAVRRLVVATFLLLALGCGCATAAGDRAGGSGGAVESTGEMSADLRYTVDVADADRGTVAITVEVDRESARATAFGVEQSWGGVRKIPSLVGDVRATSGDGERLPVRREANHWIVEHPPGARVQFRYELSERISGSSPSPTSLMFVPRISQEGVFLMGPVAMMRPGYLKGDDVVTLRFRWEGVPADWQVASSASRGRSGTIEARFSNALRVFWYGGEDLRVESRRVEGNALHAVLTGEWPFDDRAFAELAAEILRAERDYFRDHSQAYFAIGAVPLELEGTPFEGAEIMSGTGLQRSLAVFMVPDTLSENPRESFELKHLLAHELFHHWNGPQLFRMPDEREARIYWFTEGFTEHMTREILLDAGLVDRSEYLEDLNDQIAAYETNPLRTITNDELAERFWNSKNGRELAYQRGAVLALLVDRAIRVRSDGERDIGALMRHLYETEADPDVAANDRVFAAVEKFTDASFSDKLRHHVRSGDPVELTEDLLGRCYRMREAAERRPTFGFELERSLTSETVRGVEAGSPAAKAGLENGQQIVGVEKRRDTGGVELHVDIRTSSGSEKTVVVRPSYETRTTPVYEYDSEKCSTEGP